MYGVRVQCTVYRVQCTVYGVPSGPRTTCTGCILVYRLEYRYTMVYRLVYRYTMYDVRRTLYGVPSGYVYRTIGYGLVYIQCTMYCVRRIVYGVPTVPRL